MRGLLTEDFVMPRRIDTLRALNRRGALDNDLNNERSIIDKLYEKLVTDGHIIKNWVYGHFHEHNDEIINNIQSETFFPLSGFCSKKRIEDFIKIFLRYSVTGIFIH